MPYLNKSQKIKIIQAFENSDKKVCVTSLAEEIGCKRGAVYYQWSKYLKELNQDISNIPEIVTRKKSTKYTKQEEINILSYFDLYPFSSLLDCKSFLNLSFSIDTIRNVLIKNEIGTFVAKRKPFMNLSHQAKR